MPDQDNDGMYKAHDGTKFLNESEAYNHTQNKMFGESDRANNSYLTDSFTSVIDAQGQAQRNAARAAEDARDREMDEFRAEEEAMKEGDRLFYSGNLDGALKIYLSLNKLKYHSFAKAGYIYYLKGNNKKAISLYEKAEEDNNSHAPFYSLELFTSIGDYEKAVIDCRSIISRHGWVSDFHKGNQSEVVKGLFSGYSGEFIIKIDDIPQRILSVLTTAAEKGVTDAYLWLGYYYQDQFGAKKRTKNKKAETFKKAFEWFEKGALKNHEYCLLRAGQYLYEGKGVERDRKKGTEYLLKNGYHGEKYLRDQSWRRLGVFGYDIDNRMGGGKTFLLSLIFAIASGAVGGAILSELFNIDTWYYAFIAMGIGFIISLFAVRLKVLPVIALFLLITAGAGFGIYHSSAVEKGKFIPSSVTARFATSNEVSGTRNNNAEQTLQYFVPIRKVSIHSEPNINAAEIKTISAGVFVAVTNKRGSWSFIEYDGDSGWVRSSFIKKLKDDHTVTVTDSINLCSGPSGDNVLRRIPKGEILTLTGKGDSNWIQAVHNGTTGWINTDKIRW